MDTFDNCCIPWLRCTRNAPRDKEDHVTPPPITAPASSKHNVLVVSHAITAVPQKLFCSEYNATLYQHLGLLHRKVDANEYTPGDFGPYSGCPQLNALFLPGSFELQTSDKLAF